MRAPTDSLSDAAAHIAELTAQQGELLALCTYLRALLAAHGVTIGVASGITIASGPAVERYGLASRFVVQTPVGGIEVQVLPMGARESEDGAAARSLAEWLSAVTPYWSDHPATVRPSDPAGEASR